MGWKWAAVVFAGVFVLGCISQTVYIERVIDGDTVEASTGERMRLVGINSPERGEPCYEQAKNYMDSLVLAKDVDVLYYGKGKYGRALVELYRNGENLNTVMLKEGLANAYYSKDIDWGRYIEAEKIGYEKEGCMWEKSGLSRCLGVLGVKLGEWKIVNLCNVTIDTTAAIRDTSSSHRFSSPLLIAPYSSIIINEECSTTNETIGLCRHVFNKEGDEIIAYDGEGLLWRTGYGVYKYEMN